MVAGSDTPVVVTASLVACADIIFILLFTPESLSNKHKIKFKNLTFKQVC